MRLLSALAALTAVAYCAPASPAVAERSAGTDSSDLVVDLGYGLYNGTANDDAKVNNWIGIRYAASTEGKNRWQKPQTPPTDRSKVIQADVFAPNCPSGEDSPGSGPGYNYTGSEDCLFLNVQAPQGAKNLPVFVNIHGGGYGQGMASQDLTELINASNNSFVAVVIQYRLAAFGWLSSAGVKKNGVPNAGAYDQHFSLQWVQQYIKHFGGDPSRVTIMGESAGGGSVMLQALAYGGSEGSTLFENGIAASPYLPTQPKYNDAGPTRNYLHFAQLAGCYGGDINQVEQAESDGTIFSCLVGKDSNTLQNASSLVSSSVVFGQWAFIPVVDGSFSQDLPTKQLAQGKVNGKRMVTGNNAAEGVGFTPQNLTTEAAFEDWMHTLFPRFSSSQFKQLLQHNPSTNATDDPSTPNYATNGRTGASALNESSFGHGQQERANNVYAEATFVCPSYFLASGYKTSWHYQFSPAGSDSHGSDVGGYFGPTPQYLSPQFESLFMAVYANMITKDNPSVPGSGIKALENFPPWHNGPGAQMINLNLTGGTPYSGSGPFGIPVTEYEEPGLELQIQQVNAWSWEAGRGERCKFFSDVGASVPN